MSRLTGRFGGSAACYSVADLQPSLVIASSIVDVDPLPATIVQSLLTADALVLGVPDYEESYPGLFKHLLDLIDPEALRANPALLLATGGDERHALVIEHQLRQLMSFFEAATLPTCVYPSASGFRDGLPSAPALLARLDRAIEDVAPLIGAAKRLTRAA